MNDLSPSAIGAALSRVHWSKLTPEERREAMKPVTAANVKVAARRRREKRAAAKAAAEAAARRDGAE
jgi:predicted Fe-S protein YdhL (DUF1289 family)